MDQQNTAGPESRPAEAPKRRRGAQPGNNNARRKATPAAAVPPPVNVIAIKPKRTRKAKTEAAAKPETVTDATPKRKGRPPKAKPEQAPKIADPGEPITVKRKRGGQPGNTNSVGHGCGRPEAIELNDQTLNRLKLLAKIRSTQEEAAAHFDVAVSTFRLFLEKHEKAMNAWTNGHMQFNSSLRSKQIEMANAGSVPMLIWLGKQFLGQKDKHEHSTDPDAPMKHEIRVGVSPKDAAEAYAAALRAAA